MQNWYVFNEKLIQLPTNEILQSKNLLYHCFVVVEESKKADSRDSPNNGPLYYLADAIVQIQI